MAACWLLAPAPTRSPLSSAALDSLPPPSLPPEELSDSFAAPHAASARVPASVVERTAARDLLLSFNSVPFARGDRSGRRAGEGPTGSDGRQPRWPVPGRSVNGR